jgi:hypothetical protein
MKRLFYVGLLGLIAFEILNVYFIMPMPGSQRFRSIDVAYALYNWRWAFRIVFGLMVVAGAPSALRVRWAWRAVPIVLVLLALVVGWACNFMMNAQSMFSQPNHLAFQGRAQNRLDEGSIVVGVEHNGQAKAWPVRFLVYHHQVQDTVGGLPVLVTYCSVCRTGRVFEPRVGDQPEKFRLVGMDHFNAMFEDSRTGSWWRQVNGTAIAGPLKGAELPEVPSVQMTLRQWFDLHPDSQVMQPDADFLAQYDTEGRFERGESKGSLTRTDRGSWNEKSWVVGVEVAGASKAYDWNRLKELRVINDNVGETPIVLVLAADGQGFAAFARPGGEFQLEGDVLTSEGRRYDFAGRDLADPALRLRALPASQEFWHSWRTFHPETGRHEMPLPVG